MNRQIVKFISGGVAAVVSAVSLGGAALAWGPTDRPTYTMAAPADHAVFNSITDSSSIGDERDFVKIVEKGVGGTYSSKIKLEPNKEYDVYIYYHNDASATYNDKDHSYVGVATDTRLASSFPLELAAGEEGAVSGVISWASLADRDNVQKVWDEAWVTASENMTLHYVTGSAKIYNGGKTNGNVLSTNLFSEQGTYLGYNDLNGIVLGCDEYAGHVNYTIQTQATDTPPVTPENPENKPSTSTPSSLPNTGPAEVFLAIALILVIVAGVIYFTRTRRAVQKATRSARGRTSSKSTRSTKTRAKSRKK